MQPAAKAGTTPEGDCWKCRVTGTAVCLGASAYLLAQNYAQPSASRVHRMFTLLFAGGFAALGVARALSK